jgi:phage shock protein A
MSSLSEKSAFEAFARMEEKIESNERMLKASVEIDEEFVGDRLQSDFKRLEKQAGTVSADQQLLALKQKMGILPSGAPAQNRQLGSGGQGNAKGNATGTNRDELLAEIEELDQEK